MNNGFEDEDHFNFDMIMHENQYNSNKIIKDDLIKTEENPHKKDTPFTSKLKSKKNRKLALKKNKDGLGKKKYKINLVFLFQILILIFLLFYY
jgi:hypothetical protein